MAYDRNRLKEEHVLPFKDWLKEKGVPCREGKGVHQLFQAKIADGWAAASISLAGVVTTPPVMRGLISSFYAPKTETTEKARKTAPPKPDTFLEDLRDDFAMAALQGLLSNPSVLGRSPETGRVIGPNTPSLAAAEAYRIADAMISARNAPN